MQTDPRTAPHDATCPERAGPDAWATSTPRRQRGWSARPATCPGARRPGHHPRRHGAAATSWRKSARATGSAGPGSDRHDESRQKVEALLRDAQAAADAAAALAPGQPPGPGRRRPAGAVFGRAHGARRPRSGKGRIVAFGRDLRASVALQRAWSKRSRRWSATTGASARPRPATATCSRPPRSRADRRRRHAEGARGQPGRAHACAAHAARRLVGAPLAGLFEASQAERLQNLLAAARSVGPPEALRARLASDGEEVAVSASVFRQDDAAFVLVRLAAQRDAPPAARLRSVGGAAAPADNGAASHAAGLHAAVRPTAWCSPTPAAACCRPTAPSSTLAQLSAEEQARGQPLDRWLGRTGVELGVLIANLRQRGTRAACSSPRCAANTAAAPRSRSRRRCSMTARRQRARLRACATSSAALQARAAFGARWPCRVRSGELTELVGRMPLKDHRLRDHRPDRAAVHRDGAGADRRQPRLGRRSCWGCRARACTSSCAATASVDLRRRRRRGVARRARAAAPRRRVGRRTRV